MKIVCCSRQQDIKISWICRVMKPIGSPSITCPFSNALEPPVVLFLSKGQDKPSESQVLLAAGVSAHSLFSQGTRGSNPTKCVGCR